MEKTISKGMVKMSIGNAMNLKDIYLFESLNRSNITRLEEISSVKKYKKDQFLFFEGDRAESLFILIDGIVKIYKSDTKGNEVVLNHFYPIALIAELANLEHIGYPASAVFETEGKVLAIDYNLFETEFLKNPDISFLIIKSLTKKLKALDKIISQNLTMDSASKVARFIFENEDHFMELKHNKIASILNITPETMSRVMRKLKESKAVGRRDSKNRVIDREVLKKFFE